MSQTSSELARQTQGTAKRFPDRSAMKPALLDGVPTLAGALAAFAVLAALAVSYLMKIPHLW